MTRVSISAIVLLIAVLSSPVSSQTKVDRANSDPTPEANCRDPANVKHPFCYCRYPINWDTDICQGGKWFGRPDIAQNLIDTAQKEERIVGGSFVAPDTYPWFARLTSGTSTWWGCGGSLITPEYVLTAAHCTQGNTSNIGAQIGALKSPYTGTNGGQAPAQYRAGIAVFNHPSYNSNSMANDFALIRLSSRVTIEPVAVDQTNISGSYADRKENLWPIGFGTTSSGGSSTTELKHVETKYVINSRCNTMYGGDILASMMCAADPDQDSCQGDSGGPLFDSDSNTLVGVVSWGTGCADARYPGVYSRISNQWNAWIKPTICANHSEPRPAFCEGIPVCQDSPPGWYDSDGSTYNCAWYAHSSNCSKYGNFYANQGITANDACCVCGGGISGPSPTKLPSARPTQKPSSSPSFSPTRNPSETPSKAPTSTPSSKPTSKPSMSPSPSFSPSVSRMPSSSPTRVPTRTPSMSPTKSPVPPPTPAPTSFPTPASYKLCRTTNANKKINNCIKIPGCYWCSTCSVASGKCRPKTPAPTASPSSKPTRSPSESPSVSVVATVSKAVKVELDVTCPFDQSSVGNELTSEVSEAIELDGAIVQVTLLSLSDASCSGRRALVSSQVEAVIEVMISIRDAAVVDTFDDNFIKSAIDGVSSAGTFSVLSSEFIDMPSAAPSASPTSRPTPLTASPTARPTIAPTPSVWMRCRTVNARKKRNNCIKISGCIWINNSCYHVNSRGTGNIGAPASSPVKAPTPVSPPTGSNSCSSISNKNICKANSTCTWKNNRCISK